jgi:uncharacterized protein (DUF305 family)
MALGLWRLSAALLFVSAATAWGQGNPAAGGAPIVQPGAPGHAGKILTPATAAPAPRAPDKTDIEFMQGMIHHHSQAVEMVDLLRTRGRSPKLQSLGKRITISQSDEMKYMAKWLEDRGQPVSPGHAHMNHTGDMKGMDMNSMPMMPGMLTPEQMKTLAKAKGTAFDRLFLTGMIQHHTGALIMVEDLFDTPGAGQDNVLFDFATDVDNTQRAEIEIMKGMLKEIK